MFPSPVLYLCGPNSYCNPAGEYPSNLAEATPEVHVSGDFAPYDKKSKRVDLNDPTGLYHLVVGEGQNAFVANGN